MRALFDIIYLFAHQTKLFIKTNIKNKPIDSKQRMTMPTEGSIKAGNYFLMFSEFFKIIFSTVEIRKINNEALLHA